MATAPPRPDGGDGIGEGLGGGCSLSDILPKYDSKSDVTEWLENVKDAQAATGIKDMTRVISIFLVGVARTVYRRLSADKKKDMKAIEAALTSAFGMDENVAFCELVSRRWREGESVDVYYDELHLLAELASVESRVVWLVLLNGLPEKVGAELKTKTEIKTMEQDDVVDLARRIMAAAPIRSGPGPLPVGAASLLGGGTVAALEVGAAAASSIKFLCFGCGEEGHWGRNCPTKAAKKAKKKKKKQAGRRKKRADDDDETTSESGNDQGPL